MDDDEAPKLAIDFPRMAGVWANDVKVVVSRHEFTLDFGRIDHGAPAPGKGIVVARVALGAALFVELLDKLQTEWNRYAERSYPPEVHGE